MKLIDKKVVLMKRGHMAYLTTKQVADIAQAYPEITLIVVTAPYSLPKGQQAYEIAPTSEEVAQ